MHHGVTEEDAENCMPLSHLSCEGFSGGEGPKVF